MTELRLHASLRFIIYCVLIRFQGGERRSFTVSSSSHLQCCRPNPQTFIWFQWEKKKEAIQVKTASSMSGYNTRVLRVSAWLTANQEAGNSGLFSTVGTRGQFYYVCVCSDCRTCPVGLLQGRLRAAPSRQLGEAAGQTGRGLQLEACDVHVRAAFGVTWI